METIYYTAIENPHSNRPDAQAVPGKRATKLAGAHYFVPFLICLILLMSFSRTLAQTTITPVAYWRFDGANPLQDYSPFVGGTNNLSNPLGGGVINYTAAGAVDSAIIIDDLPGINRWPRFATTVVPFHDSTFFTFEAMIKPGGKEFDRGMFFFWPNRVYLQLSDYGLEAGVTLGSGQLKKTLARFTGIGIMDYDYYRDNNWHHIVFTWNSQTGTGKIYVDGQNPHEFRSYHGSSAWINPSIQQLALTHAPKVSRWKGGIDEVALYKTELTPEHVWQHWLDIQAGNHYSFTTSLTAYQVPQYDPVKENAITLKDFGIGHPTVYYTPHQLLDLYPWPRYSPRPLDSMPHIRPWFIKMARFGSSTSSENGSEGGVAMQDLIEDYHYALQLGMEGDAHIPGNLTDPNKYPYHAINLANDPNWNTIPRCIPGFWRYDSTALFFPPPPPSVSVQFRKPFILHTDMDTLTGDSGFYVFDSLTGTKYFHGAWSPTAAQGFTRPQYLFNDGVTRKNMLKRFVDLLTVKHLELIGENDEVMVKMEEEVARRDSFVNDHYLTFNGWTNWRDYLAQRRIDQKSLFRNGFRNWADSLNTAVGRDSIDLLWYSIGHREPWFDGPYEITRELLTHPRGERRSTPYYYPEYASYWRYARNQFTGWTEISRTRVEERALGERFFQPFISPGFNDGNLYNARDTSILRPGQYLGLLKALGNLGADTYIAFMYDPIIATQNWITWKPVMASYAQAAIGRERRFLEDGYPVKGDTAVFLGGEPGHPVYSFYTGNMNDLVIGRKIPLQDQWLITGTCQKNSNDPSAGVKEKDVCFVLHNDTVVPGPDDTIQLNIRLQGSTYVLDRNNPAAPVIYQTDKWHEWAEPSNWCTDMCYEAEVYDNAHNGAIIRTERPAGVSAGDFREFTTYLSYANPGGVPWDTLTNPGPILEYRNKSRVIGDPYLTVRARSVGSSGFYYRFNGLAWHYVSVASPTWAWTMPELLASISPQTDMQLEIMPQTDRVYFDRFILRSNNTPISSINTTVSIGAPFTGCTGVPIYFAATGLSFLECGMYEWDFGDGEVGYDAEFYHTYDQPGTYTVTVRVELGCEVYATTDTHTITISGPYAEAGPDIFRCGPDSITLTMDSTNAPFFHWIANNRRLPSAPDAPYVGYILDSTVMHPTVFPDDTLRWYFLVVEDSNGCKSKDSLRALDLKAHITASVDSNSQCADTVRLSVDGAWRATWSPGLLLSDSTSLTPYAIATDLDLPMLFTVQGWDANGCDTSYAEVYVSCCEVPSADRVDGKLLASDLGLPATTISNLQFHVLDSFIVDQDMDFFNCTFWMDKNAVVLVKPGFTLTVNRTVFRSACSNYMWEGIVVAGSTAEMRMDTSRIQEAAIGAHSLQGGKFDLRYSTLDMNAVHIKMEDYNSAQSTTVRGCTLTCTYPLIFPHNGEITLKAIECDNAGAWTFGDSNLVGRRNLVEKATIGIQSAKTSLTVANNIFRDIKATLTPSGYTLGTGIAILSKDPIPFGTNPRGYLTVGHATNDSYRNFFERCYEGINAHKDQDIIIRRANMDEIGFRGIFVSKNTGGKVIIAKDTIRDAKMGIQLGVLTNCTLEVDQNVIESYIGTDNTGILCDGLTTLSTNYDYQITNNHILMAGRGIYARVSSRMYLFQNTINMATMPFAPPVGFQTYAIRFEDCNGNRVWTNRLESDPTNIGPDSLNPGRYWMNGAWFMDSPNTDFWCNDIDNHGWAITWEGQCTPSQMYNNVMRASVKGLVLINSGIIGQQGSLAQSSGNNWIGPCRQSETDMRDNTDGALSVFYVKVLPSTLNPMDNDDWASSVSITPVATTKNPPVCLGSIPSANKTIEYEQIAMGNYAAASLPDENEWKAEKALYSELKTDPALMGSSSQFPVAFSRLDTTQKAEITRMQEEYLHGPTSSAIGIQSGLRPGCTIEEHLQKTWGIFLQSYASGQDFITEPDKITLREIALDCPLSGGQGVIFARALLATEGEYIWSHMDCPEEVRKTNVTQPESDVNAFGAQSFEVYPNPAADQLTLHNKGTVSGTTTIWNTAGVKMGSWQFTLDQPPITLPVSQWPGGIYFYQFAPESGNTQSGRITIMGIR